MNCLTCKDFKKEDYVGETSRVLRIRIAEHLNTRGSSEVAKHIKEKHILTDINNWDIKILAQEKDDLKRKIMEAYFIAKMNPSINKSKGIDVIGLDNLNFMHFESS